MLQERQQLYPERMSHVTLHSSTLQPINSPLRLSYQGSMTTPYTVVSRLPQDTHYWDPEIVKMAAMLDGRLLMLQMQPLVRQSVRRSRNASSSA